MIKLFVIYKIFLLKKRGVKKVGLGQSGESNIRFLRRIEFVFSKLNVNVSVLFKIRLLIGLQ